MRQAYSSSGTVSLQQTCKLTCESCKEQTKFCVAKYFTPLKLLYVWQKITQLDNYSYISRIRHKTSKLTTRFASSEPAKQRSQTRVIRALRRLIRYDNTWYDIFVNSNWVATRWQRYSTHLHTNRTQNNTIIYFGRVRAVPRLCELYPGICLTTEEKARRNLSQGREKPQSV